ncbi:hypothetical protein HON36_06140 [Candidatus Parcubacteria bacterium]|jgi:cytochrome c553|nr:hypothetical protein [Candidatus Parcubacteria bacterium]MBT7228883.1 hypothetical protein [Candidatus Parcubacteria bacterium]
MDTKISRTDLQNKVNEIKALHEDYLIKLRALQKKQKNIMSKTVKNIEDKKIRKIKEGINNI